MNLELVILLLVAFIAGYIVFKIVKRLIVAIITVVAFFLAIVVAFSVLIYQDIHSFSEHPTKKVLLILIAENENRAFSAAVYSPIKKTEQNIQQGNFQESSDDSFSFVNDQTLDVIGNALRTQSYDLMLNDYVKLLFFTPQSIDYVIKENVSVFSMNFTPQEIKNIVKASDPRPLLLNKSLHDEKYRLEIFFNVFTSTERLKGSLFFGSLFDQMRKNEVVSLIGLIQAFHHQTIRVIEETPVFTLIKLSPISIARGILQRARNAIEVFSQSEFDLPSFGQGDLVHYQKRIPDMKNKNTSPT